MKKQLQVDQALVDSLEKGGNIEEKSDIINPFMRVLVNIWRVLWRIGNFIPKSIVTYLVKKTANDPHFIGTMRYTFTIFLYPLIYLLLYFLFKNLLF